MPLIANLSPVAQVRSDVLGSAQGEALAWHKPKAQSVVCGEGCVVQAPLTSAGVHVRLRRAGGGFIFLCRTVSLILIFPPSLTAFLGGKTSSDIFSAFTNRSLHGVINNSDIDFLKRSI